MKGYALSLTFSYLSSIQRCPEWFGWPFFLKKKTLFPLYLGWGQRQRKVILMLQKPGVWRVISRALQVIRSSVTLAGTAGILFHIYDNLPTRNILATSHGHSPLYSQFIHKYSQVFQILASDSWVDSTCSQATRRFSCAPILLRKCSSEVDFCHRIPPAHIDSIHLRIPVALNVRFLFVGHE
jgi:hypothetical protein